MKALNEIYEEAKRMADEITTWRRELHRFPECGLVLPKTAAWVKARLTEMGIAYQTYERHSGITAVLGSGNGPVVALRADMDGLAVGEQTGLLFSSENENMHACGHDAHTAILLGAAKLLKQRENELPGRVKLLFQPGEEGPGGALPMVEDGVLESPSVDRILALHVGTLAGVHKSGDIVVSYSNSFAADDQVIIRIKGRGGHGSTPDVCIDPVAIAALVINNLQYIISREIPPGLPAVITFASVDAGRGTYNVIADEAVIKGTIRSANLELRAFIFRRMREILEGLTIAMRAKFELEFLDGYPPLINNRGVVERFLATASTMLPPEDIHILEGGLMGGEDAAFFFERVPGCYFFLCTPQENPQDGQRYNAHSARFCIDDSVLYQGTALLAQAAMDLMK